MRAIALPFAIGGGLAVPVANAAPQAVTTYLGPCDASAAVALDAEHFIVANDESNLLVTYRVGATVARGQRGRGHVPGGRRQERGGHRGRGQDRLSRVLDRFAQPQLPRRGAGDTASPLRNRHRRRRGAARRAGGHALPRPAAGPDGRAVARFVESRRGGQARGGSRRRPQHRGTGGNAAGRPARGLPQSIARGSRAGGADRQSCRGGAAASARDSGSRSRSTSADEVSAASGSWGPSTTSWLARSPMRGRSRSFAGRGVQATRPCRFPWTSAACGRRRCSRCPVRPASCSSSDDGGIMVDGRECKKLSRSKQQFRTMTLTP